MPPTSPSRQRPHSPLHTLQNHRFAILFLFLLGSLAAYPYAEVSGAGYIVFRLLSAAILLLTVYAVSFRRGLIVLVLFLSVPALLSHVLMAPADTGTLSLLNRLLSLSFDLLIIGIIVRRVFNRRRLDAETIAGALCIYLLIGYTFASVYGILESHRGHIFYLDPTVNQRLVPDRFDLIYFSFGTMTELGTPGITAISPLARSISLIEAILGILYLAVLISRLMSSYQATFQPGLLYEAEARSPSPDAQKGELE